VGWAGRISEATGIGPRTQVAVAGLGLAFAVLAGLVAAGGLTSVDQYAVEHWMPALEPGRAPTKSSRRFYLPFSSHRNWWSKALDIWTYPCSVLISLLVLLAVLVVLRRRGRAAAGLLWIGAWVVGTGIEVVGKEMITRPALYGTARGVRLHVSAFDQAFPSGHMLRCAIVAGAIVFVWRRALRAVLFWALLVPVCLVLTSAHTPSDLVGGALLGLMLVVLGQALSQGDPPVNA
jgi:hypothetical protein